MKILSLDAPVGQEIRHACHMGHSRARTKHLQKLWAQQGDTRRAPHLFNSNSKQTADEQLQLQPAAAEQLSMLRSSGRPETPVEQ